MPVTDNQLQSIFRYFDGDLSDEEEEQLMRQLQQNAELQQAFDQQVLMQQFKPGELIAPVINTNTESADDFLKRVTGSIETTPAITTVRPASVVKRNNTWMAVAAAAAVLVCVLAITTYYFNQKNIGNRVVKLPVKDSIAQIKQPGQKQFQNDTVAAPKEDLQQLYADNYGVYSGYDLNAPPAATIYESEYKQGNYKKLADESESILGTKGGDDPDEEAAVANYFHFYKALANVQVGNTATAEKMLKKLLKGSAGKTELGNPVKWYLLMVYLKSNNKQAALEMADRLTMDKRNFYYKKASEIKVKLGL